MVVSLGMSDRLILSFVICMVADFESATKINSLDEELSIHLLPTSIQVCIFESESNTGC